MELEDPKVRRAFVKYILALQNPQRLLLREETATILVELLSRKFRQLPNGHKTLFSISVKEAADFLRVEPKEIIRIITGREGHKSRTAHEFEYGVDFVQDFQNELSNPTLAHVTKVLMNLPVSTRKKYIQHLFELHGIVANLIPLIVYFMIVVKSGSKRVGPSLETMVNSLPILIDIANEAKESSFGSCVIIHD